MTFELARILQSKREFRKRLAARPFEEKLSMLDALRARAVILRKSRHDTEAGTVQEEPLAYRAKPKQIG
jgi:hypothetical protein